MPLFTPTERRFVDAIALLARANPFLPERLDAERQVLGSAFQAAGLVWRAESGVAPRQSNVVEIKQQVQRLADRARERLAGNADASTEDLRLYQDLIGYFLYTRYEDAFYDLIAKRPATSPVGFYAQYLRDVHYYLAPNTATLPLVPEAAHLFALFFQIRRAFHFIFRNILGGSMPAARLRAAVWQSILTTDLVRYGRSWYAAMGDIATLIVGPSGTGKELVAQAISYARYIPFDPVKRAFHLDFAATFHPLTVAALPSTLIESELFGHKRGAFTGAVQDRPGRLELCPPLGTVFFDEIAEVDVTIQVKLLRVLETRTFQRLGDSASRRFEGKIIAATNRSLAAEMRAGRFREDLYYRLCADLIETPSLAERLRDSPGELRELLLFLARRVAGEAEAEAMAGQVERWIDTELGPGYSWPGNVRELEQCVRNVMIRGAYRPPRPTPSTAEDALVEGFLEGSLPADALLRRYCTLVYARTGSYHETARRLGLDRRTVRSRVDPALLARLRPGPDPGEKASARRHR